MDKVGTGLMTSRYGKIPSGVVLEDIVEKYPKRKRALVDIIISEFKSGLKFLATADERYIYVAMRDLWVKEFKRRIEQSALPEELKSYTKNITIALSRRHYRDTFVSRGWCSKRELAEFSNAKTNHDQDYDEIIKRGQQK